MWRSQAEAEGLTLLEADSKTGYFGVYLNKPGKPKPYEAQVSRGGNKVSLGMYARARGGRGAPASTVCPHAHDPLPLSVSLHSLVDAPHPTLQYKP